MFVAYDSVTLDEIPATASVVFAYVNGMYNNYNEAKGKFPHAHVFGISVEGIAASDAYDIEKGDYEPSQVQQLFKYAHEHGIWRPIFYASKDNGMPAVQEALLAVTDRANFRLWVADYTYEAHIPAGFDGCQWTDKALNRNLDESLLVSSFIPESQAPKPARNQAHLEYDPADGHWYVEGVAHNSFPPIK